MSRDELATLRDALDLLVKLPDHLRDQLVEWLAPEAAKPNGRDPHPPSIADRRESATGLSSPRRSPTPYAGKASPRGPLASAKAEQKLPRRDGGQSGPQRRRSDEGRLRRAIEDRRSRATTRHPWNGGEGRRRPMAHRGREGARFERLWFARTRAAPSVAAGGMTTAATPERPVDGTFQTPSPSPSLRPPEPLARRPRASRGFVRSVNDEKRQLWRGCATAEPRASLLLEG